jgi:SAM-dependent methyltransferase
MDLTARAAELLDGRPDGLLLDVGCGSGELLRLAGPGVGVDLRGAAGVRADARALPFADGAFGAAASLLVVHYLERPDLALAELRRVLRPGGTLVLADRVASPLPALRERQTRLERRRNPGLGRLLTEGELVDAVESAGFRVLALESRALRTTVGAWCGSDGELRAALGAEPSNLGGLRRDGEDGLEFRVGLVQACREG